ncbi:MAG TPA: glycosyltransferase family 4 protein [Kiritimatiellia bacterium]|nr:glycosyltransferase family 4 protein [Kiritimatiellia bacterium]HMP34399.1 glycosyltransferase family 4 protein [Kiritimatiellia bacterium]
MKRFLFLSTAETLPWGGSESLWAEVARHLLAAGHQVAFSYRYWPEEPTVLAALRKAGAVAHYRQAPGESAWPARIARAVRRKRLAAQYPAFTLPHWILSLVMEERPDFIVLNACDAYMVWPYGAAFRQVRAQGIPYAVICQLEDESHMFLPDKRSALTSLYGEAETVSFGSSFGARLVSRQLAIDLPRVEIFDNPPNGSGQLQPWPGTDGGVRRFACVGRLDVPAKGHDVILASFAAPAWRDRAWRLSFYGKGPEEDHLRRLVAHYGLSDRVDFAGFKGNIDSVWAGEEIFLQPSPKEGTPMTVVEAMSAGRPGVVSDIGRMPDLIEEGVSGWICSRGVPSFSAALERAWAERDRWPEMGRAAHATIRANWKFDYARQMAEQYVSLTAGQNE